MSGKSIFSCSADKKVRRHSTDNKELIRAFSGHKDWVYALAIDGKTNRLASGSYDGEVRVWNLEDGQVLTAFTAAPGYRVAEETVRASTGE